LLGLGAAGILPIASRAFRPFAVEVAALGMTVVAELRRVVAEQRENLEDIAAEARLRHEELAAAAELDDEHAAEDVETDSGAAPEDPPVTRSRARRAARARTHAS